MKAPSIRAIRCAIYTRVSTEHGLDQEFNSLDAQYDAASAYIKSQAHARLEPDPVAIMTTADIPVGPTDRPDLQRLLDDIRSRKLDVIVVYKVDRLTRSLADFAKLVVNCSMRMALSFVSVTQQFNTTTSMGRLISTCFCLSPSLRGRSLHERIRDKIAASKRKGLLGRRSPPPRLSHEGPDKISRPSRTRPNGFRLIYRRYLEHRRQSMHWCETSGEREYPIQI